MKANEGKQTSIVLNKTGAATNTRIIIVDSDASHDSEMVRYFESFDIKAISVSGVLELYRSLAQTASSLVILDLRLAREHGFDLLHKLHNEFRVPVILTGDLPNDTEGIIWLESGADDYLAKPLRLRELVARSRAILRRAPANDVGRTTRGTRRRGYIFNGWTLDRRSRILQDQTGEPLKLTRGECSLLIALLEKPWQIQSKIELMRAVRVNPDTVDRSIDIMVASLRRKLQKRPDEPRIIETVRAIGYSLNAVVEAF